MMNLKRLRSSLTHALHGVRVIFKTEQSFRLQVFSGMVVLFFAYVFDVSSFEYIILLLLIGIVLSLELINSVFERIVDTFKPRIHPIVKDIKDIMAATVLIMSCIALLIGIAIFYPYIASLVLS